MLTIKNLKLSAKLNLILLGILLSTIVSSGLLLSQILEIKTEQEVADKAFLLIETMNSVRSYTSDRIQPKLSNILDQEEQFVAETVPAYSAKIVFQGLQKREEYQDFFYKEATLNPTNLQDKADNFETEIIDKFRQDMGLKELTGFRSLHGEKFYYIARPLSIKKTSCLKCHGEPKNAPQSLLNTYGQTHGFGWKINEIVASQIVSVPANKVFDIARKLKFSIISIVFIFFIVATLIINLFLNLAIVKPIKSMANLSTIISTGNLDAEFYHKNNDEIGILAKALNRMKLSLQMALNMLEQDEESN